MTETKRKPVLTPDQIAARQKQIDIGKHTSEYRWYLKSVPRHERGDNCPNTPIASSRRSLRSFRGLVNKWRRALHDWAEKHVPQEELELDSALVDIDLN